MKNIVENGDYRHLRTNEINDHEVEKLWEELEDIPFYEDADGCMCLDVDWNGFSKGTDREEVWHWFHEHHSKGVGWLMNEYESHWEKDKIK